VKENHVEHWLNETKIVEYEYGSQDLQKLIAESKFNSMPHFAKAIEGHIGLQHHGEEVWYRNIRIRKL
jgi:dihydroneopterin aldolase